MAEKKDGEFIISLLREFFEQESITEKLQQFNEHEEYKIRGWEVWWQVEFALFLEKHNEVAEWLREYSYELDGRRTNQKTLKIDFLIRKKNCSISEYIALELKQAYSFSKCIRGMFKDVDKYGLIKQSEDDIRSFWNAGIFIKDIQQETKDLDNEGLEKWLIDRGEEYKLINSCVKIRELDNTVYKLIVF